MKADFGVAELSDAIAGVAAGAPEELAAHAGVDWHALRGVASDAAANVLGRDLVPLGAEAFEAGFLVGARLSGAEGSLADAVALVQERGRHVFIADSCDLAAVADVETIYAASLAESAAASDEVVQPLTRLFETGLAVGLAL